MDSLPFLQEPERSHNGAAHRPAPSAPLPAHAEEAPKRAESDRLARRRDEHGNRHPWFYSHSVAVIDETPLEETPLASVLAVIREQKPALASHLHHFYDHRLLPAIRRFHQVCRETEQEQAQINAHAADTNTRLAFQQEQIAWERDQAARSDKEALLSLDEPLAEAHREACARVAAVGGRYDPADPNEACVLRIEPRPLEVIAGEQKLPFDPYDGEAKASRFAWLLTVIVGTLIGLSLGLMSRCLEADALGEQWPLVLVCAVLGTGVAAASKLGVQKVWGLAAHECYLPAPVSRQAALLANALFWTLLLLAADLKVEQQGLLSIRDLQRGMDSLSHPEGSASGDNLVLWLAPVLLTLGYLICAAVEGFVRKRHVTVENRLKAAQGKEFQEAQEARRQDADVRQALEAIAGVHELHLRQSALAARIAEAAQPFDARIAELAGRHLPLSAELSLTGKHLIQDALDELHGAQEDFDRKLSEALLVCEPTGGRMRQAGKAIVGYRPQRLLGRERKRKLS